MDVNKLLQDALAAGASDIHIEPWTTPSASAGAGTVSSVRPGCSTRAAWRNW